jgi:hypothetical protein
MENWKFHDIGFDGQTMKINGKNIWRYSWEPLKQKPFKAPHPAHEDQIHTFTIYRINFKGGNVTFAATEVSNLVWCFYVPV